MADSRNLILAPRNLVAAAPINTTSASSHNVSTGTKVFALASVQGFYKGAAVTIYKADDSAVSLRALITVLDLSGWVEVSVSSVTGAGTGITNWTVVLDMWTGGSWLSALPLANLATPELWKVARSADALPASTKGRCDFGIASSVGVLSLLGGNQAITDRWRHHLFNIDPVTGAVETIYDTALLDIWPPDVEWGTLPWGQFPWSGRKPVPLAQRMPPTHFTAEMWQLTSATLASFTATDKTFVTDQATDQVRIGQQVSVVPSAQTYPDLRAQLGRVLDKTDNTLLIKVTDLDNAGGSLSAWTIRGLLQNADGSPVARKSKGARFWEFDLLVGNQLDLGAAYAGPVTQPSRNRANGMPIQFVDPSRVERSRGGQVYIDPRRPYRRFTLQIPYLSRDEAFVLVDDLRLLGRATPFLVFFDPGDFVNGARQTGYVVQAEQPVLRHQVGPWWSIDLTLEDYL